MWLSHDAFRVTATPFPREYVSTYGFLVAFVYNGLRWSHEKDEMGVSLLVKLNKIDDGSFAKQIAKTRSRALAPEKGEDKSHLPRSSVLYFR